MMDCEQHGANVFEVIDLINRDYPRGGIALARPHRRARACARTSPSPRSARTRRACCSPSRASTSRVPLLPRRGHQAPARRRCRGRKVAVLGLAFKARHRRRARLARRTSSSACSSASWPTSRSTTRTSPTPTQSFDEAVAGADAVVVATNHSEFDGPGPLARDRRARRRRLPRRRPVERASAPAQVFAYAAEVAALARPRCRRSMNRVLVTGGAGTIGAAVVRRLLRDPDYEVRVSDQRAAPRLDARGLRGPHRRPARRSTRPASAIAGCSHVIHLAAIVGGIANFHKLPAHADRGQQRALQRASCARRSTTTSSASSTCRARWSSSAPTEFPTTEEHIWPTARCPRSAYGFSKLTGEVYCRAAHDEHGLPYTICRPFNAYGPGEMPEDEPGHRPRGPRPHPQGAAPAERAAADLRRRRRRRGRSPTSTTSPTGSSPRWPRRPALNEDFNISASRRADGGRDRARSSGRRAGNDPDDVRARAPADASRSTSLRRWPSVEKAARLLGWEARIGVERGIAQTVEWLRTQPVSAGAA